MKKLPFIAVEGPIGVGKTSLTKAIAREFNFAILKEIVEENPFLEKFYEDIEEWSFQTEMFFLSNRYKQLKDTNKNYISKGVPVVSDYHVFKNTIFAEKNLKEKEFEKYMKIYETLVSDLEKPNMVIYLNASLDTLKKRISIRGRHFEENIDDGYLENLSNDYDIFMEKFKKENSDVPVLYFDGDEYDFVNNKDHLNHILKEIKESLKGNLTEAIV